MTLGEITIDLKINNLKEFKELILKAKNQSEQLEQTITQIENFEFNTDVDFKSKT